MMLVRLGLRVLLPALLLVILTVGSAPARADTDTIEVVHLPLAEATAIARSQLSPDGRIAQLPSRRLLVITDNAANIEMAREMINRLDAAPTQLVVRVAISEQSRREINSAEVTELVLPGGWVRLAVTDDARHISNKRNFMLRTSSGSPGHIEAGEIQLVGQRVRQYLTTHGIVSESRVQMLDVTAGFDVQATLLSGNQVHLAIHPWLREAAPNRSSTGRTELATGAGNTINMQSPTSPAGNGERIMVAEAATELTVKLGESVSLAASQSAANEFSSVLLGRGSLNSQNQLSISVTVSRAGM